MRDEFPRSVKDILAKRVNYHCSNPNCRRPTSGPHENPAKSVSVGVAAHLTAAALGGPRFNALMSIVERTSIANGIWLCQTCAKLVDSDCERYTLTTLSEWKSGAEALATWEIEGKDTVRLQAFGHALIPSIYGQCYDEARERLLTCGWQPYARHWTHGSSIDIQNGNGQIFWARGYHELVSASSTGYGFCRFEFKDVYENKLVVVTAGEEDPDTGSRGGVVRWFFERDMPTHNF